MALCAAMCTRWDGTVMSCPSFIGTTLCVAMHTRQDGTAMSCPRCWYDLVRGDAYKVGQDGNVLSQVLIMALCAARCTRQDGTAMSCPSFIGTTLCVAMHTRWDGTAMSCPRCWYGLVRGDAYKVGWDGDVLSQVLVWPCAWRCIQGGMGRRCPVLVSLDNLVCGDVHKVGWDGDVLSQFYWDNLVRGDAYKAGRDGDVLSQVLVWPCVQRCVQGGTGRQCPVPGAGMTLCVAMHTRQDRTAMSSPILLSDVNIKKLHRSPLDYYSKQCRYYLSKSKSSGLRLQQIFLPGLFW
jgi:hypothetical protein